MNVASRVQITHASRHRERCLDQRVEREEGPDTNCLQERSELVRQGEALRASWLTRGCSDALARSTSPDTLATTLRYFGRGGFVETRPRVVDVGPRN